MDEILTAILNEYDVDEATAKKDLSDFLSKLHKMEII